MGRRRWSAIAVTGDIDDAIGLGSIDQVHTHNADILIGANSLRTTDVRFRQEGATILRVRNIADTGDLDLWTRIYIASDRVDFSQTPTGEIRSQTGVGSDIDITSHDGAAFIDNIRTRGGRARALFPDKAGAADAGDFDWDPAAGAGFEGFIYDTVNGRIYWFGAGGVHHVNQTAGIEFGAEHHSCPICGDKFRVKDLIKMQIDHFKTDGSPHAVPVHERCIGK